MTNLTEVNFADIRNIFNASYRKRDKVTQFGQSIDNPNLTNVNDPTLIDTLDLLHDLYDECDECYDMTACSMHDLEGTQFEWVHDLKETAHINTYNWSAPLTNDIDFKVYEDDKTYILLSVQNGYSDARCGYMVEFLFTFDTSYSNDDWAILFNELPSANKSFMTSNDYSFNYNIFSEAGVYNIYKDKGTYYDEYDVYVGDYDECEEYANKLEAEETEEV